MKKLYSIGIIFLIVVSYCTTIVAVVKLTQKEEVPRTISHYATPEEAIEKDLQVQDYILLESNETYLGLCDSKVNDYACQYILNDGEGWQVVTDYMFRNCLFDKRDKDFLYEIYIREYMGKYMVYVVQPYFSIDEYGLITIEDSLNSEFVDAEYESVYKQHYWYWCLDEIPDDYTISINGNIVYG